MKICTALLLAACLVAGLSLTAVHSEEKAGAIEPFNGKDLTGWLYRDKTKSKWTVGTAKQSAENLASTGVDQFLPNSVLAARAKEQQKEQDALNAKVEKETTPLAEHSTAATASLVSDVGQQVASNPRLAKLIQMSSAKKCKQ